MRRWRTIAFVDTPSNDGRMVTDLRLPDESVAVRHVAYRRSEACGWAEVRIVGYAVQARLPWRWRKAGADLMPTGESDTNFTGNGRLMVLSGYRLAGVSFPSPSPWEQLR